MKICRCDEAGLAAAVECLTSGGVAVIPTDTVYGLAASPKFPEAVERLYTIKGREAKKPIAMLAGDAAATGVVHALARRWPGALTIVSEGEGYRVPDHEWTRELLRRCGGLLRVTSANLSGQRAATDAPAALKEVGLSADLVIDDGISPGGTASTVVKLASDGSIAVLRPGPVKVRIGIYGGSFNPVHFGHLNVARKAVEELDLDRLLVIPAAVSPFKTAAGLDLALRNGPERLEYARAVFAQVARAEVDDRELRRGGVSYAIDTVREIAAENPGAELYFIIGEDSVEGLPRWKDIDELRRLVTFRSFPRTSESSTEIRELFAAHGVTENPDAKIVGVVRQGLVRKGGFCPCRLPKTPEFFCPCDEFKAQLRDPAYHGLCHCRLYLKP